MIQLNKEIFASTQNDRTLINFISHSFFFYYFLLFKLAYLYEQ